MNYSNKRSYLMTGFVLVILTMMLGCATGGKTSPDVSVGKGAAEPAVISSKGATVSIIPAGVGQFIIQGNNVDDIAGFDLTITYDNSILTAPTVTNSAVNSGAMMVANTNIPGTIRFVMISTKPFSGTVALATASFASVKGQGGISITSASMVNGKGMMVK